MPSIHQFPEPSMNMQQRNLTSNQQKNMAITKEGMIVNTLIKEPSMKETYDNLLISSNSNLPKELFEKNEKEPSASKKILKIAGIALSVMAGLAATTFFMKNNTKNHLKMVQNPLEKLPFLQRNIAINDETHHAVYQMIQTPNQKTIIGAFGVLILGSIGFVGKNIIDGIKEVLVKKNEADISKNLQENLIEVETLSFSGKNKIIRNMLSEKADYFKQYIDIENPIKPKNFDAFHSFKNFKLSFKQNSSSNPQQKEKSNLPIYLTTAMGILGTIGLGFLAIKNLSNSAKNIEDYKKQIHNFMQTIISKKDATAGDKKNLQNIFLSLGSKKEEISENLKNLKWKTIDNQKFDKKLFEKETITLVTKSSEDVSEAIGGKGIPKPSFYSHIDDCRAHLYNWILNIDNPMFKNLFFGITTITGLAYSGQKLVEGVKEIEVKKYNAEIELDLQKRLVGTELRNFKAKKDSAIQPLMENFNKKLTSNAPKTELLTTANSILSEIKNGPPFIYS